MRGCNQSRFPKVYFFSELVIGGNDEREKKCEEINFLEKQHLHYSVGVVFFVAGVKMVAVLEKRKIFVLKE